MGECAGNGGFISGLIRDLQEGSRGRPTSHWCQIHDESLFQLSWLCSPSVLYTAGVIAAIENIQAKIPKEDLAIQFDIAVEFAVLEKFSEAWFGQDEDVLFQRVVNLTALAKPGVELGFHLCYGDFGHKHFKEPDDAHFLNLAAVELIKRVGRSIEFIHLPVPLVRDDAKFFAPFKELHSVRGNTEIHLGLVNPDDLEGTQRRVCE